MENILEIKNVSKTFKEFKLKNLSINLPMGTIMGFVGENGAGKSTTIKLILELIRKDSGNIKIFGQEGLSSELKEQIGVVLDECCFPDNLNIKNIEKIMKMTFKTWDSKTFANYVNKFDLSTTKVVKDYSRGMKMKLSIAIALSHNTKLLILDEATSGLDPIVRDEILDIFLDFIQDESHSVFISSHIISDLEKICDYIAFIHKGELVFCESKDDLIEKYGILKCSEAELVDVDSASIIGKRKNKFGIEALVKKDEVARGMMVDNATIEEIMLYHIKEGK